ncbi:MAG: DNA mismatch repair protein MutS [Alphaproteobacteria bacterium]|nr:DNA mismatch repair protein MutS [Alphaproteobacteria bacterium]
MTDLAAQHGPASGQTTDPGATPMMAQYLEVKRRHPGSLLFYRMGDFYELFFEDAEIAARALDLTLTRRGKHLGQDIPMCGVPAHSHESYLLRLIRQGHRVAICDQLEDPAEAKKRGAKSVVRRDVTRVITPGTLTEDTLLDARRSNHLAAIALAQNELAVAWIEMSVGTFLMQRIADRADLPSVLARIAPGEILVADKLLERDDVAAALADWKALLTPLPGPRFDSENARRRLEAIFTVKTLDGFGAFGRAELAAAGALVDYIDQTQRGRLPRLVPPAAWSPGGTMEIDPATRRNLELETTIAGERKGSLLDTIDWTLTGAGARLLADDLAGPLVDPAAIDTRLDVVDHFVVAAIARAELREHLRRLPDLERALQRLAMGRAGPRDLAAVRDGLATIPSIRAILRAPELGTLPALLARLREELGLHEALVARLAAALAAELPLAASDGGFIAAGLDPDLDELRALRDDSRKHIAGLQVRYAEATGVAGLKIRHNNVLGYYIEVNATHGERLRTDRSFIHRQTMAGAVRFTTVELSDLESRIVSAGDRALARELEHFEALRAAVVAESEAIGRAARALARLDVAAALAELAVARDWRRPVVDATHGFAIEGGRHPVVEAALLARGDSFVPNDCDLDAETQAALWLLTGPNMAGKSTFLRQNALIAILAQAGCFVPAARARIGLVDRVFSRVGAADDLARGRSTFMVEMVETAAILNRAGRRALVILDEIGRGTATFDGLSIAWATIEHLHGVNRCRALFATHYHELTALAAKLDGLACHTMRVKEWQGDVVFLHEVAPGTADRSYGIHVAQLAGLPPAVIERANAVLSALEKRGESDNVARLADDLPLFTAATRPRGGAAAAAAGPSPIEVELRALNPDDLTPRQAIDALYRLRGLLR